MNQITQSIQLNFRPRSPLPTVNSQIGDTNRTVRISVWDGLHRYLLQPDTTAILSARKPDGTSLYNICEIRDNYVYYHFTEQTTSCLGLTRAELRLYGGEENLLATMPFFICVHNTAFQPADAVKSKDEQTALNALVNRTQELQNNILEWKQNHQLDGYSAYELAKQRGFAGTEDQWLQSLRYDHSEEFQLLSQQVKNDQLAAAASADQAQSAALQAEGHSNDAAASAQNAETFRLGAQQAQAAAETQAEISLRESAAALKSKEDADLSAAHAAASEAAVRSYGETTKQSLSEQLAMAESHKDQAQASAAEAAEKAKAALDAAQDARSEADRSIALGLSQAKPGDWIRIRQVDSSGAPTAWEVFDGGDEEINWELIETVEFPEPAGLFRDKEPNGIKYLFKTLAINFSFPEVTKYRDFLYFRDPKGRSFQRILINTGNLDYTRCSARCYNLCGIWRTECLQEKAHSNSAILSYGIYSDQWNEANHLIGGIRFVAPVPKGTKIQIWAVR